MTQPRFPNESEDYRRARDELLAAEAELRQRLEDVAALRRTLPLGGRVKEDYVFDGIGGGGVVEKLRLSALFEPGKESLFVYGFMFGPQAEEPCPLWNVLDLTPEGRGSDWYPALSYAD